MKSIITQSRTTENKRRSKNLYFLSHIFHYLFRCKHDLIIISDDCFLDNPLRRYFSKKPTLPVISVIVGFFLCLKIDKHFIYTFNF